MPHCWELSAALLKEIRSSGMFDNYDQSWVSKGLDLSTLIYHSSNIYAQSSASFEEADDVKSERGSLSKQSGLCHLWKLCVQTMMRTKVCFIVLTETSLQTITPRNGHQAVHSTRSAHWIAAMNREKQCHIKNGTFGEEWKDGNGAVKPIRLGVQGQVSRTSD